MKNKLLNIGTLFNIIIFLILSWILVHLLAFLGIFLAVAYPIWWFFVPQLTVCVVCRSKHEGEWCNFCRKPLTKANGIFPKNMLSAILNGVIIFLLSLFSVGVVFAESKLLYRLGFPSTPRTVSFVIPTKGQHRIGEIFPMKIEIVGIKVAINAVQADVSFDNNKLELVDISTEDSFANIFIQKEINNDVGYGRLTGGLPNPGFLDEQGTFATLYFKAKSPGLTQIVFQPTSMVLANDGRGTNVLKEFSTVSYIIMPEQISQEEEDLQSQVFFDTKVLGASTLDSQMTFYDTPSVLGNGIDLEATPSSDIEIDHNTNSFWYQALSLLESVDTFILSLYKQLFANSL